MVFLEIFARTVSLILQVVSFSMLLRMLLPLFIDAEESRFYALTCYISEPFIAPIRLIMVKLNVGQNSPIDWAFFVTYFVLWILELILPVL